MTVITYREGVMSADRRLTWDDRLIGAGECKLICGKTEKFRYVAGIAGDAQPAEMDRELVEQFLATGKPPDADHTYDFMVYYRTTSFTAPHRVGRAPPRLAIVSKDKTSRGATVFGAENMPKYFAIGCGGPVAMGAMYAGATAVKAVDAATAHNSGCGDGCDVENANLWEHD